MSRVLVTGGTGFIGRHAVSALVGAGHDVHLTARRPPADRSLPWSALDLLAEDPGPLLAAVEPEVLVHLAWVTEHGRYWESPDNVDWLAASLRLLRAFLEAGGHRVVLGGTCMDDGSTLYGASKAALGDVATVLAPPYGATFAVARLHLMFGPDEAPDRLVPSVARALLAGLPAEATSGRVLRDFLDVRDVGAAIAAIAGAEISGPVDVGRGTPVAVADVVRLLGELAGRPDLVRLGARPDRPGEPERLVADVEPLADVVGFRPAITLRDGLADALEWWRAQVGPTVRT